jgi:hypothetical protein
MSRRRSLLAVAVALAVAVGVLSTTLAVPASAEPAPTYRPPVDAPVLDPFRAPTTPFGPGNRGLEYGTAPGTPVRAVADGRVTFAGSVAGSLHVTVLHPDGLRTTSSFLSTIDVVVGQEVHQGDRLGTTAGPFQLSARNGDAYLDPALLFAPGPPRVRLVPFDVPPGSGPGGERSAIRQLIGGLGSAIGGAARVSGATLDWLQSSAPDLVRLALHYGPRALPITGAVLVAFTSVQAVRAAWEVARRPCTPATTRATAPPERRVAVLVGGLGSTSEHAAIADVHVRELGYEDPDVVRFSYAGGPTPRSSRSVPSAVATRYDAEDSQQDLRLSARRLADLVEAVAADHLGVPIDLIAHSQGGLVARLAVLELEQRHGRAWLDRLGLLATLGTPHGGADLATAAQGIESSRVGEVGLEQVGSLVAPDLHPGAASEGQLSELSDLVQYLDDHPVAPGLHAVSIAARGDVVVPVPRARLEGAPEVIVPLAGVGAHDQLPGSAAATRELALALSGAPPTCTSFATALLDQAVGGAISQVESSAGGGLWAGLTVLEARMPPLP